MRTLDRKYLATHPQGAEKTDLDITIPIPESVDIAANPDGTRPVITLHVEADTYAIALGTLSAVHEDYDDLVDAWVASALTEEQAAEVNALGDDEDMPDFLVNAVSQIHPEFLKLESEFSAVNSAGESVDIKLTVTAPSISLAVGAFKAMTKPSALTNLAIGLCPETREDEDWDGSNDVLVR